MTPQDLVGVTNPFLQFGQSSSGTEEMSCTIPVSTATTSEQKNNQRPTTTWWPSCFIEPREKKKWRVLTYRGRVGSGLECYNRVRDAVLDWEFQNDDGSAGLLTIPASSNDRRSRFSRRSYSVSPTDEENSMPFHCTIGNARRMVSFTSSRLPLLPALYAVNPVMVVYDLVDQR
jgi:hypothetical protein